MLEYIDRIKCFTIINNYKKSVDDKGKVIVDAILDIVAIICPTADVVPVVRCKDCKHAVNHRHSPNFFKCNGCNFLRGRLVNSDFYCKYGEKKDGENNG